MKNTTTLSCGSSSSSGDSLDDISVDGYKRRKLVPQRGRVNRRSRSNSRHIDDESASSNATSKSTFMDLEKVGVTTRSGLRLRDR